MAKYIHNISGSTKNYHGFDIANGDFYQIPENLLTEFQTDLSLLVDLLGGSVRMSGDGATDYSNLNLNNLNYLKDVIAKDVNLANVEIDDQGRQTLRIASAKAGWSYIAKFIEWETSTIGSLKSRNSLNQNTSCCSIKFYDSNNSEITASENESTIIKTEITFKPPHDYEVIAGHIHQRSSPDTDIYINVVGGILELGSNYTKEFTTGLNLYFMGADEQIETDGRSSKFMAKDINGVPYQANQFKIICYHNAGVKHKIMIAFEYYRA
jgi:hypothetical protein